MIDKNLLFRSISGNSAATTSIVTSWTTSWVTSRLTALYTSQTTSVTTPYPEVETWRYAPYSVRIYTASSPEVLNIPDGTYTGLVGVSTAAPTVSLPATSIVKSGTTFTISPVTMVDITYGEGTFYNQVYDFLDYAVYNINGYNIYFSTNATVLTWRTTDITTSWTTSWAYASVTTNFFTSATTSATTSWLTI